MSDPVSRTTEFRRDQVKLLLVTALRTLAPHMAGRGSLRKVFEELHRDEALWAELDSSRRAAHELLNPEPPP